MAEEQKRIDSIASVTLENFRGWVRKKTVYFSEKDGTPADIVLITAANGRGKSSLIEALSLIVDRESLYDKKVLVSIGKDRYEVKAEANIISEDENQPDQNAEPRPPPRTVAHDDDEWTKRIDDLEKDGLTSSMLGMFSVFSQEDLEGQFETGRLGPRDSRGTLLEFLVPSPNSLIKYENAINTALKKWRGERPQKGDRVAISVLESARRTYEQRTEEFLEKIEPIFHEDLAGDTAVERLFDLIRKKGGMDSFEGGFHLLERRLDEHARTLSEMTKKLDAARKTLEEAQDRLEKHELDWPRIWDFLAWGGGLTSIDELLGLLDGLAERPSDWLDASRLEEALKIAPETSRNEIPSLEVLTRDLAAEFRTADRARAAEYSKSTKEWRDFWMSRQRERNDLIHARNEARDELASLERQSVVTQGHRLLNNLRDAHHALRSREERHNEYIKKQRLWKKREPLIAILQEQNKLLDSMRKENLDKTVSAAIERTISVIFEHFVVAGLEESKEKIKVDITPDRKLEIFFSDNRGLQHFSTGQKAQTALAWLLAANALIQKWMPHRLLLLDDISTALDLTNLAAESVLLRKFAYAKDKDGKDKERKRQIIIASHHDQLTHRMFDLLLPPQGFTMREIRLVDWNFEKGPDVNEYAIKPTKRATDASRGELAERLAKTISCGE